MIIQSLTKHNKACYIHDMNDLPKDIMTLKEFAEYIQVHPNTVRKMIRSGHLSSFKSGTAKNSSYRIARSEIERMALINLHEIIDDKALQKRNKILLPISYRDRKLMNIHILRS